MNNHFKTIILQKTGASSLIEKEVIQELWSGYGKIIRVGLENASLESVVVKHVQLPKSQNHPRGWHTDIGHQRKLKSYEVETKWYQTYSKHSKARLPKCFGIENYQDETLIILEDLDAAGFPLRKQNVEWEDIDRCLEWLAQFHANYLGKTPNGLWDVGTYWHLETRPQELEVLDDIALKNAATAIDKKLNNCNFKTFVHGDAKLANFCFSKNGEVAGVDFQYVGGGCGMKDVAYFIGSCLNESDCERLESKILNTYFMHLDNVLGKKNEALENEWRSLYRVAWADFHRFLKGWSPSHWKINSYSERITSEVIKNLY
ncbi:choline kinase [Algibacter marinivivus]|uniref:Choline kinase n=1 Tax=Algibacter marinivivus TaxID=2100723 RepID=A0A2U2X7M3_9FLAO|nr:oxidoreductase family protein [Algibacter marinivivus]PWH83779.1 choline kinase [Algibacter marinivivus]